MKQCIPSMFYAHDREMSYLRSKLLFDFFSSLVKVFAGELLQCLVLWGKRERAHSGLAIHATLPLTFLLSSSYFDFHLSASSERCCLCADSADVSPDNYVCSKSNELMALYYNTRIGCSIHTTFSALMCGGISPSYSSNFSSPS